MTVLTLFYEGRPVGESHSWRQNAHQLTLKNCELELFDGMVLEVSATPEGARIAGVVQSHEGETTIVRLDLALLLSLKEES